jgi:hypothetical protein
MPEDRTSVAPQVTIFVNNRPVVMDDREANGAQIKAAADVPADFSLFHEHGGRLEPVGDGDVIKLHPNERFRAVSGQDVS